MQSKKIHINVKPLKQLVKILEYRILCFPYDVLDMKFPLGERHAKIPCDRQLKLINQTM